MFHFHKWSDWSTTEKGKVYDHLGHVIRGTYITQERYCLDSKCGLTKLRTEASCSILDINSYRLKPDSFKVNLKHDIARGR